MVGVMKTHRAASPFRGGGARSSWSRFMFDIRFSRTLCFDVHVWSNFPDHETEDSQRGECNGAEHEGGRKEREEVMKDEWHGTPDGSADLSQFSWARQHFSLVKFGECRHNLPILWPSLFPPFSAIQTQKR